MLHKTFCAGRYFEGWFLCQSLTARHFDLLSYLPILSLYSSGSDSPRLDSSGSYSDAYWDSSDPYLDSSGSYSGSESNSDYSGSDPAEPQGLGSSSELTLANNPELMLRRKLPMNPPWFG